MNETTRILTHYLRQIIRRAELTGFDEMEAEIESAAEADAQHARTTNERAKPGTSRQIARVLRFPHTLVPPNCIAWQAIGEHATQLGAHFEVRNEPTEVIVITYWDLDPTAAEHKG